MIDWGGGDCSWDARFGVSYCSYLMTLMVHCHGPPY